MIEVSLVVLYAVQDVYVASVCLEANYGQVMKAFAEAEAHKGVSLVVAYAPCVMQVCLEDTLVILLWCHSVRHVSF